MFKVRPEDFVVVEVNDHGELALPYPIVPDPDPVAAAEPSLNVAAVVEVFKGFLPENIVSDFEAYYDRVSRLFDECTETIDDASSLTFTIPCEMNKENRTAFHAVVRSHLPRFGSLATNGQTSIVPARRLRACPSYRPPSEVTHIRNRNTWPKEVPEVLRFSAAKLNHDADGLMRGIGSSLGIPSRAFGVAGQKDKRAITSQFVTIPRLSATAAAAKLRNDATPALPAIATDAPMAPAEAQDAAVPDAASPAPAAGADQRRRGRRETAPPPPSVMCGGYAYVPEPLARGDLRGNAFGIVLRNASASHVIGGEAQPVAAADAPAAAGDAEARANALVDRMCARFKPESQAEGATFVNYFGAQRFGAGGSSTAAVGSALVRSSFAEALLMLIGGRAGTTRCTPPANEGAADGAQWATMEAIWDAVAAYEDVDDDAADPSGAAAAGGDGAPAGAGAKEDGDDATKGADGADDDKNEGEDDDDANADDGAAKVEGEEAGEDADADAGGDADAGDADDADGTTAAAGGPHGASAPCDVSFVVGAVATALSILRTARVTGAEDGCPPPRIVPYAVVGSLLNLTATGDARRRALRGSVLRSAFDDVLYVPPSFGSGGTATAALAAVAESEAAAAAGLPAAAGDDKSAGVTEVVAAAADGAEAAALSPADGEASAPPAPAAGDAAGDADIAPADASAAPEAAPASDVAAAAAAAPADAPTGAARPPLPAFDSLTIQQRVRASIAAAGCLAVAAAAALPHGGAFASEGRLIRALIRTLQNAARAAARGTLQPEGGAGQQAGGGGRGYGRGRDGGRGGRGRDSRGRFGDRGTPNAVRLREVIDAGAGGTSLYLHAIQSAAWNAVAAVRGAAGTAVVGGDLVMGGGAGYVAGAPRERRFDGGRFGGRGGGRGGRGGRDERGKRPRDEVTEGDTGGSLVRCGVAASTTPGLLRPRVGAGADASGSVPGVAGDAEVATASVLDVTAALVGIRSRLPQPLPRPQSAAATPSVVACPAGVPASAWDAIMTAVAESSAGDTPASGDVVASTVLHALGAGGFPTSEAARDGRCYGGWRRVFASAEGFAWRVVAYSKERESLYNVVPPLALRKVDAESDEDRCTDDGAVCGGDGQSMNKFVHDLVTRSGEDSNGDVSTIPPLVIHCSRCGYRRTGNELTAACAARSIIGMTMRFGLPSSSYATVFLASFLNVPDL